MYICIQGPSRTNQNIQLSLRSLPLPSQRTLFLLPPNRWRGGEGGGPWGSVVVDLWVGVRLPIPRTKHHTTRRRRWEADSNPLSHHRGGETIPSPPADCHHPPSAVSRVHHNSSGHCHNWSPWTSRQTTLKWKPCCWYERGHFAGVVNQ